MTEPEPSEGTPPPGRAVCPRCERPLVVCYCAHLHALSTQTRVILLQHPREQEMAVGTARMAHLSLPNSVLRVGLDFAPDAVVKAELAAAPAVYVLFPKPGARDLRELRGIPGVKLVVIDGTWRQAKRLLRLNPRLQALPAVAFTPSHPSEYRIRKQPAAHCVSTIEALAEALGLIEPAGFAAEKLLEPFHAMVARQQWYQTEVGQGRSRHVKRRTPRKSPFARLAQDYGRLVCVQGEANAWPVRD
ncbi:MAG: tRNA-uridine aminocarboxypropyltransferase, partial [bacterium]